MSSARDAHSRADGHVIRDVVVTVLVSIAVWGAAVYPGIQDIMHGTDIFGSAGR